MQNCSFNRKSETGGGIFQKQPTNCRQIGDGMRHRQLAGSLKPSNTIQIFQKRKRPIKKLPTNQPTKKVSKQNVVMYSESGVICMS